MASTWHYQPNTEEHRTACGRIDNYRSPFAFTDDTRDVSCRACLRSRVFINVTSTDR